VLILLHLEMSVNRASTERQQSVNRASTEHRQSINTASTEWQQSVNDFGCCILYNPRALLRHIPIMNVLAAVMSKRDHDMVTAPVWKWASTEHQQSINRASTEHQQSINTASTECQQSVNDFGCCILYNPRALLRHIPIIKVLAAVMSNRDRDMVPAPVWKWASTERQRFGVLHLV